MKMKKKSHKYPVSFLSFNPFEILEFFTIFWIQILLSFICFLE